MQKSSKVIMKTQNNTNSNNNNDHNNYNTNKTILIIMIIIIITMEIIRHLLTSSVVSRGAPLSISTLTTSKWPLLDALCKGVDPSYEWNAY